MLLLQLLVWFALSGITYCRDLRVGAFNIQIFGKTKAKKQDVMDILVKIIRRYDLLLIQEIRDSRPGHPAINQLLDQVNEGQTEPFSMILSKRLGRTSSKEQYAYFYRPAAGLSVLQHYEYEDSKMQDGKVVDLFERQPFVAHFTSSKTTLRSFVLIGIHVDPDKAVEEINDLYKYVVNDVKVNLREPDLMVLGDLNADCNYVSKTKWKKIPMKTNPQFDWLIGDEQDTTVKGTHCAYDRFITNGPGWVDSIVPGSAEVFKFDQERTIIGDIDRPLAEAVSDHYPIEFMLAAKQFVIIVVSNGIYINLAGPYADKGSLPINQLYELSLYDETEAVLIVYDNTGQLVGEINNVDTDEKMLTEVLLYTITRTNKNVKLYIEPIKNRWHGKQKVELFVALPATDEKMVSEVWSLLNGVCGATEFRCSKSG